MIRVVPVEKQKTMIRGMMVGDDRMFSASRSGWTSKAVNGDDVSSGNLPWHTILEDSNCGTLCGGAIINTKFILTAAHCVDSFKKHPQISCPGTLSQLPKVLSYPANIMSKFYLGLRIYLSIRIFR